ncbi:MAG: nitroreductase [Rhodospirillales bacterium]|nr:nitroreductase [Rhodospirillales bacterium]
MSNADTAPGLNVNDSTPLDLLASRRSVLAARLIAPGPSCDELDRMLEIAVRVPDHGCLTPWCLQVLSPVAQAELGELFVDEFRKAEPDANAERLELERIRPQRSPVLVVVSSRTTADRDGVPPVEQLLSCGNVCFNLLNAATAMGYGAQWVSNWCAYNERIKSALGIPTDEHLVGYIHIGTPKNAPSERQRPEIADVVHRVASLSQLA